MIEKSEMDGEASSGVNTVEERDGDKKKGEEEMMMMKRERFKKITGIKSRKMTAAKLRVVNVIVIVTVEERNRERRGKRERVKRIGKREERED